MKTIDAERTARAIERLENRYNGEHDLFDDAIQMNHIDAELLRIIEHLHERIVKLETNL